MAQPQQKKLENDARFVFGRLNEQRVAGKYCDIVLVSGVQRFTVHRCVLAANSPYFDGDFIAKGSAEVDLTRRDDSGIDEATLALLIDFFYLGSIIIDKNNAHSLLAGADFLMVSKVKEGCAQFLYSVLSPATCLDIWTITVEHSCKDLEKMAFDYAQKCFYKNATSDDFLNLSLKQVLELLNGDQLTAASEESICLAAFDWIRHQQGERKKHLRNILGSIRLMQCDRKFLEETLKADNLIQENEQCLRLVDNAIHQWLIFVESKEAKLTQIEARRSVPYKKDTLYAMGGLDDTGTVKKYDLLTNSFSNVAPMLTCRHSFGAVTINDQILVMGGVSDDLTSSVDRYNPFGDHWSTLAPMLTARQDFGVAVLDDYVYAVGGTLASEDSTSILERYDPMCDSWTTMTPMGSAHSECAAVALNNRLYVLGGSVDGVTALATIEIFDPSTGVWSPSLPMPLGRHAFGCTVFDGKIFVAGGWGTTDRLSSVVSFNTTDQQWSDNGNLSSERSGLSLAVIDGRLLAIGGCDPSGAVTTVDEYVPETNSWRHLGDMNEARYYHGVAVI